MTTTVVRIYPAVTQVQVRPQITRVTVADNTGPQGIQGPIGVTGATGPQGNPGTPAVYSDDLPLVAGNAASGDTGAASRSNHVHPLQPHGDQAGGTLHAIAVASGAAGFLSGADKAKLDAVTEGTAATHAYVDVRRVIAKTTNGTLASSESGATITNTGAAGDITQTLPAASPGLNYRIIVDASHVLALVAHAGETIRYDGFTTIAGGGLESSNTDAVLELEAIAAGSWIVTNLRNEWSEV